MNLTVNHSFNPINVMEYLLFSLWAIAMAIMVGKSIIAYRSLQKTLNRTNSII